MKIRVTMNNNEYDFHSVKEACEMVDRHNDKPIGKYTLANLMANLPRLVYAKRIRHTHQLEFI